jgi:lipoate---protein ligase
LLTGHYIPRPGLGPSAIEGRGNNRQAAYAGDQLKTFRLLDTGKLSAAANMALDKIIVEEVAGLHSPPTLRFLQFGPAAALVGYHQDVELEIRLDYCRDQGIEINRRHTGGGSILFQESALGWELFGVPGEEPFQGGYGAVLERICHIASSAISQFGIRARFRPRNDIEVDGRKISGTGGMTISGGFMFQGTLLVENEVDLFLKALRVPVEKLKKREIESLMQRICFLSDLVQPAPPMEQIKQTMASEFSDKLRVRLVHEGLTARESRRLSEETAYFESPAWVMSRSRPPREGEPIRSICQTEAGTLRVHLWLAPGGKRVRQALISGDFFAVPGRIVHDLEAALVGVSAERNALKDCVISFFRQSNGEIAGISADKVADAVAAAGERRLLVDENLSGSEVNELFLLNLSPKEIYRHRPKWLLLPYCSKNLDCDFRRIPGCEECGRCDIGECFGLARSLSIEPITIQSFEHLMETLRYKCADSDGLYVGSCCEAFYAKHQREMEEVNARGILVNLDSTTCYDLGKGSRAYKGLFDNKTSLNLELISKTLRQLHARHSPL